MRVSQSSSSVKGSEQRSLELRPIGFGILDQNLHVIETGSLNVLLGEKSPEKVNGVSIFEIFPQLSTIEKDLISLAKAVQQGKEGYQPVYYSLMAEGSVFQLLFEASLNTKTVILIYSDLGKFTHLGNDYLELQEKLRTAQNQLIEKSRNYKKIEDQLKEASVNLFQTQDDFNNRVARLEALHRISVALSSTRETKALLQLIVEQASILLDADSCSVALLDSETGELVFQAAVDDIVGKRIPSGQGIMFRSLIQGGAQVVHDVLSDPDHYKQTGEESNLRTRSMVAVPLQISEGENIGVLAAVNRKAKWFSDEDRDLLVTIASYAAIALENTRLFEQIQEQARGLEIKVAERTSELRVLSERQTALAEAERTQRAEAETRARELKIREQHLATLNEITRTAIEQQDLHTMLKIIADRLIDLFRATGCSITFWDEKKRLALPVFSTGPSSFLYEQITYSKKECSITEKVLTDGTAIFIENLQKSEFVYWNVQDFKTIKSFLAIPFIADKQKLGAAMLGFSKRRHMSEHEIALGEQVARQVALTITKIRAIDIARQAAREAETLREAGAIVAETLNQKEAIERILLQLARVIPYDSASVQLLRNNNLEIVGGRGWLEEEKMLGWRFPIPAENPNTIVVQERRILNLGDARNSFSSFMENPHNYIRSWLGVPLIVRDTVIGMLALDSTELDYFTPRHAELAMAFADQVAVAIENTRLFETTQRNEFEAKIARDILHRLNSVPDLIESFPSVTESLKSLTGCARISLALLSEDKSDFTMVALDHPSPTLSQGTTLPVSSTSSASSILEGNIHITPDLSLEVDLPAEKFLYAAGHRSRINIPLQTPDGIIGAFNLTWTKPNGFIIAQIPILTQIADAIALALQKARLYSMQSYRARKLDELRAVIALISSELETSKLYEIIPEHAASLIDAKAGEIGRFVESENLLEITGSFKMGKDFRGSTIQVGHGALGYVVRTREPLLLDDYRSWEGRLPVYEHGPWIGLIASPIAQGEKLLGGIALVDDRPERIFTSSDLQLLTLFADQVAITLENARLFQEVQTLATLDELTKINNRRKLFELGHIEFDKSRRHNLPFSAAMIDIDHFKKVNDTYGHATGDKVMRILTQRCQLEIRNSDILGRYGGEEFTVLLPVTTTQDAQNLAERLRESIADEPFQTDRGDIVITISIGVASLTDDIPDLASLIDRADTALLQAKNSGRNRIEIYQPGKLSQ